jgi:hypothetical protein
MSVGQDKPTENKEKSLNFIGQSKPIETKSYLPTTRASRWKLARLYLPSAMSAEGNYSQVNFHRMTIAVRS